MKKTKEVTVKEKIKEFFKPTIWKIISMFIIGGILYGLIVVGYILAWASPPHNLVFKILMSMSFFMLGINGAVVDSLPIHPFISVLILWIPILYFLSCSIIFIVKKFRNTKK